MLEGGYPVRRTIHLSMATFVVAVALCAGPASAADMTVVLADDSPAAMDFVAHLRSVDAASLRLTQSRIDTLDLAQLASLTDEANADSIARGLRRSPDTDSRQAPRSSLGVLVGVGARAARALAERPGREPILLALLGRVDFEILRTLPQLRSGERAVGVLLIDPPPALQLTLITALLPNARRIGVISTPEAEPLLKSLRAAAQSSRRTWMINAARAPSSQDLASALQTVLPTSDLLLILPDPIGATPTASLALLQAAAVANVPAFAANESMVRAGALAALVPGSAQLARQAHVLGQRLLHAQPGPPVVETAARFDVRTNPHVARRLGVALPSDAELAAGLVPPD